MKQFSYKCVVNKNGNKMYYKRVNKKWKRISNKIGQKAEKKGKYQIQNNKNFLKIIKEKVEEEEEKKAIEYQKDGDDECNPEYKKRTKKTHALCVARINLDIYSEVKNFSDLLSLGVAFLNGYLARTPHYREAMVTDDYDNESLKLLININENGIYTIDGQPGVCSVSYPVKENYESIERSEYMYNDEGDEGYKEDIEDLKKKYKPNNILCNDSHNTFSCSSLNYNKLVYAEQNPYLDGFMLTKEAIKLCTYLNDKGYYAFYTPINNEKDSIKAKLNSKNVISRLEKNVNLDQIIKDKTFWVTKEITIDIENNDKNPKQTIKINLPPKNSFQCADFDDRKKEKKNLWTLVNGMWFEDISDRNIFTNFENYLDPKIYSSLEKQLSILHIIDYSKECKDSFELTKIKKSNEYKGPSYKGPNKMLKDIFTYLNKN